MITGLRIRSDSILGVVKRRRTIAMVASFPLIGVALDWTAAGIAARRNCKVGRTFWLDRQS
jgi:hypothetical protein